MERKMVFKALVGSHNYNLNTAESDKDYKVFVLPTFEDLYNQKMYANQTVGETEDIHIHDIRKFPSLLYKANINFLEVLFSNEITISSDLSRTQETLINLIFNRKNDIAVMNLPHLFNSCGGMHLNKMKMLYKGTEGTQHLVDAFGYDTKQALHAYRVLNFICKFAESDFKDFEGAMTYSDEERKFMLDIKGGFFNAQTYENFVTFYHDAKFKILKERYYSFEPNEKLRDELEEVVMEIVKISM